MMPGWETEDEATDRKSRSESLSLALRLASDTRRHTQLQGPDGSWTLTIVTLAGHGSTAGMRADGDRSRSSRDTGFCCSPSHLAPLCSYVV